MINSLKKILSPTIDLKNIAVGTSKIFTETDIEILPDLVNENLTKIATFQPKDQKTKDEIYFYEQLTEYAQEAIYGNIKKILNLSLGNMYFQTNSLQESITHASVTLDALIEIKYHHINQNKTQEYLLKYSYLESKLSSFINNVYKNNFSSITASTKNNPYYQYMPRNEHESRLATQMYILLYISKDSHITENPESFLTKNNQDSLETQLEFLKTAYAQFLYDQENIDHMMHIIDQI